MRTAGRRGHGERARVEQRVRALLGTPEVEPSRPSRHRAPSALGRFLGHAGASAEPGRNGALAMAAVVGLVALVAGAWVLSSRPHSVAVAPSPASARGSAPSQPSTHPGSASSSASRILVVDVAGKVRRPGLYRLPAGARVNDAVHAAGGPLPGVDLTTLNLAAPLGDGQQVSVGVPQAAGSSVGASTAQPGSGPVNLNSATVDQLETLPGIGPALAQHIIDWRNAHGQFASLNQLDDVPGIGATKFAALRSLVTL